MDDLEISKAPRVLEAIFRDTESIGFKMGSERQTGSLLRTLAASKTGCRFLELGTGTGIGTAWLLAGMDHQSRLDSVDNDPRAMDIARRHLGSDSRVTFHLKDGAEFLGGRRPESYDFIYADTWPGKFTHLDVTLSLLRVGGLYVVDDLLPQATWPEDHAPKVPRLISDLENRGDLVCTKLAWASGLMVVTRVRAG